MRLRTRVIRRLLGFYFKRIRLGPQDLVVFVGHDIESMRRLATVLTGQDVPAPILIIDETVVDVRRLVDLPEEVKNRIKNAL